MLHHEFNSCNIARCGVFRTATCTFSPADELCVLRVMKSLTIACAGATSLTACLLDTLSLGFPQPPRPKEALANIGRRWLTRLAPLIGYVVHLIDGLASMDDTMSIRRIVQRVQSRSTAKIAVVTVMAMTPCGGLLLIATSLLCWWTIVYPTYAFQYYIRFSPYELILMGAFVTIIDWTTHVAVLLLSWQAYTVLNRSMRSNMEAPYLTTVIGWLNHPVQAILNSPCIGDCVKRQVARLTSASMYHT